MVAERSCGSAEPSVEGQILDALVPQIAEQLLEVPKIVLQDQILQGTVEQILDVLVLEKAEQLVEVPKTVPQDRIQQRTVEQIVDAPVPQAVEELAEVFRVFSQDRIQQRTLEQIIPATSLAEMIVEVLVIQMQGKTQQGVNTHAQHVVNTVEVERRKIIKQTVQKPVIQEKIGQVTKHVEIPELQFTDKVGIPVVARRQIHVNPDVQKTIEISQLQHTDDVVDVPVQLVAQVPRVLVVEKTTEIPQFRVAELLKFNTSKPGDEQISFKEYVDRLKEGQNGISHITDESIAVVSSSWFREILRRKGYEVHYMADPVDEFAVQQPTECDGTKPKSTLKEDLEADIAKHTGAAAWQRQPHSIKQQPTEQTAQERKGEKKKRGQVEKEKGQGERERGERGKREEETGEKGKEVQEETDNEVENNVTGWTEVSRKRKKMVQIFVKVDGGKTSVMEMEMNDKVDDVVKKIPISDQDVYVTSGGRILKGSDKLKSCQVQDGSTVEVTSRMRGGGKHNEKKSKVEKKQGMKQEPLKNEGPAILESEKEAVIRMLEETEEYRKIVEDVSGGSDVDVERKMGHWASILQERPRGDVLECGLRWAVEARRKGRDKQQEQRRQAKQGEKTEQEQSKQGKQVRFDEEQQLGKTGVENAGEPEVMGRTTELRTGRGSTGLVRGGDERFRADETSRKGKGKGNGGKGEHEGKGGGFGTTENSKR